MIIHLAVRPKRRWCCERPNAAEGEPGDMIRNLFDAGSIKAGRTERLYDMPRHLMVQTLSGYAECSEERNVAVFSIR